MRITGTEIKEQGLNLKAWLSGLQRIIKKGEAPKFKLSGPCSFEVRRRASAGPRRSGKYVFMGDEEFMMADIFSEPTTPPTAVDISVTLVPASPSLIKEISGATMHLSRAMALFQGLDDWFEKARIEASATPAVDPALKRPVIEKTEEREAWGAW